MHGVARPNKLYYYLLIIYILYISLLIYSEFHKGETFFT